MSLLKIYVCFLLMLNGVAILKAQPINPSSGDGFWSQINTMRMNQIIWINDTLYASRNPLYQSNGGVYRSIDGGVSWDTLNSVSDVLSSGLRLFIHPTNHKILYMIYGALYMSTNSGQSWQTIFGSVGPLVRLGINPKNPYIMYVTKSIPYGAVFKTIDAGLNWNDASNGLPSEEYFQAGPIEVNPEFPDTILLGSNTGLYRSTNGGMSWDTTQVKGFIPGLNFHPHLLNIAFASTTYDWATYKTTDFGRSWYKTIGSSGEFAKNFVFHSLNPNIIYNTENLKSIDTGNTWFKIDTLNSWVDLTSDKNKDILLFGSAGSYGLYVFKDVLLSVSDINNSSERQNFHSFPNPFNNSTTIMFELNRNSFITINIYNALGQKIKTLVNQTAFSTGQHSYLWNGQDDYYSDVAGGFYLCLISIENEEQKKVQSLKLLLLK